MNFLTRNSKGISQNGSSSFKTTANTLKVNASIMENNQSITNYNPEDVKQKSIDCSYNAR